MIYRLLADAVVLLHLAFVFFVFLGGLLVLRRPRLLWVHLPAVAWGAWVEFTGRVCPLTPLENWLRRRGGGPGYASDFIEHYIEPILYPPSLTVKAQWVLGAVVVAANVIVYLAVLRRRRARRA
jgi:hypothetical protein